MAFMSGTVLLLSVLTSTESAAAAPPSDYESNVRKGRQISGLAEICDFGSDGELTLCDWIVKNGTGTKWEAGAGTLSNWIGGPAKDASGGAEKGGYAFFEPSLLGSPDARTPSSATMDSKTYETTGPEGKCLTFSYSLDGLSAAGLRVLLRPARRDDVPVGPDRELWAARDPTGKKWLPASVLFTFNTDYQLVLEGLARDANDPRRKFRGHVAVDDVALKGGGECKGHCTFEGGLCGWTNIEEDDDFDWQLGRGSQSPATGPATDRSSSAYGGLQGGYVYIDSGFPRRPGDFARLASSELEPTEKDSPICLRFWTHMYGNGIGTLEIRAADLREEGKEQLLWSLTGEGGNGWYQAQVSVFSPNPFRIILVGRVGKNALGDIAVDDISLSPGSCPTAPQAAASSRTDCTFEVDECGWSNVPPRERSDDMDWERTSGASRRDTVRDHSLATEKGSLMTLERSNVQRPGSRAWLSSERINGTGQPICLSFWYLMNEPFIDPAGPSLGSLSVLVRTVATPETPSEKIFIWRLYNNQGPEWKYAQASITRSSDFNIIFEGSWGSSRASGLIGIDDISVFPSDCTTTPSAAIVRSAECHFERDTCQWSNETGPATWRLATLARRPSSLPDRTFSSPEGYVFFDQFATNKKGPRDTARLVSPTVPASDGQVYCLSFWFAAFGVGDSAELRVVKADNSSGEVKVEKLWVLRSDGLDTAHPQWSAAQVAFESSQDLTLLLEGTAVNGGFAIDDVSLGVGSCAIRPLDALPPRNDIDTRR